MKLHIEQGEGLENDADVEVTAEELAVLLPLFRVAVIYDEDGNALRFERLSFDVGEGWRIETEAGDD